MIFKTFKMSNTSKWIITIIVTVFVALLIFCFGYYLGWTQEYRTLSRQKIGDVVSYTTSLDSIYKYGSPASKHTYSFESAIDIGIIQYVQSRDGGSLGINEIYLGRDYDKTIKILAKRVARYRKSHPISVDWCTESAKCKTLLEQDSILKITVDSMAQYILNEK